MKGITLLFLTLFSTTLFSQITIKGIVTGEKNEPIIGANVFLKDTYDGTSTGEDGTFEFSTLETGPQTLIISYIGYEEFSQVIDIQNQPIEINPNLIEEANELNTVTITAGKIEIICALR